MAKLYAGETAEVILDRILARVAERFDKRLGSIIYDATAPAAIELELLYEAIDYCLDQSFADTAERPYLIRRAAERGLAPYPATFAKVTGVFTPAELEIPAGSRFACGEYTYTIGDWIDNTGRWFLTCETAGAEPNGQTGRLIPVETIPGLRTAELVEVSILGEDEEETEAFRKRYFERLQGEAYGGNIADYQEKIGQMQGVGGVKVYPAWNGGGTVRCVIIDSEYGVPTTALVDEVQQAVDPITVDGDNTQGQGVGLAPIGHYVTIIGASAEQVNVRARLTFTGENTYATARADILAALDEYYKALNAEWQNSNSIIVTISGIISKLLGVPGVIDVQQVTINGVATNAVLDPDSIAIWGEFEGI